MLVFNNFVQNGVQNTQTAMIYTVWLFWEKKSLDSKRN